MRSRSTNTDPVTLPPLLPARSASMHMSPRRSSRQRQPINLEAAHRLILVNVRGLEKRFAGLQSTAEPVSDWDALIQEARRAVEQAGVAEDSIETPLALKNALVSGECQDQVLFSICDDAARMEERVQKLLNAVEDVVKLLNKYCHSYAPPESAEDIKCISNYEQTVTEHKETLESQHKQLVDSFAEYKYLRTPFISGHLEGHEWTEGAVKDMRDCGAAICRQMKKWVSDDNEYTKSLYHSLVAAMRRKKELQKAVSQMEKKLLIETSNFTKVGTTHAQSMDRLETSRTEMGVLHRRKEKLQGNTNRAQAKLDVSKEKFERISHEFDNRTSNSPKYVERLWALRKEQEEEVRRLEGRLYALQRQKGRFDKQIAQLSEVIQGLEREEEKAGDAERRAKRHLGQTADRLHNMKDETDKEQNNIQTIRSIRQAKLEPGKKVEPKQPDPLEDAFRHVSLHSGRFWEQLYLALTFDPPRTHIQKKRDLDKLVLHSVERGVTARHLAWTALRKWQMLSRTCSVKLIVNALKTLNQNALADTLKEHVMT